MKNYLYIYNRDHKNKLLSIHIKYFIAYYFILIFTGVLNLLLLPFGKISYLETHWLGVMLRSSKEE